MIPKVLVGAPICDLYKYCFDEFLNNIKNFTYKNYDILLVDNSKDDKFYNEIKDKVRVIRLKYYERMRERVVQAHNLLREVTLKENYDYLLNLDQDIIPPRDVIERLLSHDKQLVSGLYFGHHILDSGNNQVMPFAWVFKDKSKGHWGNLRYLNENEIWQPELIKIAFAGAGCILIHKSVLEKIRFRYSLKIDAWDDRWLGYDAAKHNIEYYLDNTVKCKHLYLNRPFDYQKDIKAKGKN